MMGVRGTKGRNAAECFLDAPRVAAGRAAGDWAAGAKRSATERRSGRSA